MVLWLIYQVQKDSISASQTFGFQNINRVWAKYCCSLVQLTPGRVALSFPDAGHKKSGVWSELPALQWTQRSVCLLRQIYFRCLKSTTRDALLIRGYWFIESMCLDCTLPLGKVGPWDLELREKRNMMENDFSCVWYNSLQVYKNSYSYKDIKKLNKPNCHRSLMHRTHDKRAHGANSRSYQCEWLLVWIILLQIIWIVHTSNWSLTKSLLLVVLV